MGHFAERRIIGESRGKLAHATVPPTWDGECVLHYRLEGGAKAVRFPNYPTARTAAIRAIFSEDYELDGILVSKYLPHDRSLPLFRNAGVWFEHLERRSAKAI